MSRGHSAAWDQEWEHAAGYYRQALEEFPESTQAQISLASAYFELGDYEAALGQYRAVVATSPNDILVLEKIAQIFEILGQRVAGAETALRVADVHFKRGDTAKALENWMRTIRLHPGNLRARSRLAIHFEKLNHLPQAVSHYIVIAGILQHQGSKEKAFEILKHAIKLQPSSAEANQALGLLRANQILPIPDVRSPRPEGTRAETIRTPAQLNPPTVDASPKLDPIAAAEKEALSILAGMLFEQDEKAGEGREGRDLHEITMGTGPLKSVHQEQTRILMHVGQAVDLQARGQTAQAAEELERAILTGLDHSAAHYELGAMFYQEGQMDQSIRSLQTAVKHPDFALPARLLLGRIYARQDRLHDSAVHFLEALRVADSLLVPTEKRDALLQVYEPLIDAYTNQNDAALNSRLARGIEQLLVQADWFEKLRKARRQLADQPDGLPPLPLVEVIVHLPGSRVVDMLSRIHELARSGYYRIAMEEAFSAIQHAPTYLPLHTLMGEMLMQQDRVPEAITKFNTVARAYSSRGEAARSIGLFRRITQLAPFDLSTRQRLIEQLTASGQIEETIQEYLELGDVYYRLAELDQARATYQRALNLSQQAQVPDEWMIEILHHLADIDMQRLDWTRATKIFEQITRIDAGDKKAALNLVDLQYRMLNETAALAALGNYVAYLNRSGRQPEALESLESLVANNPDQPAIKRTLAEQYQLVDNRQRALETWDEIAEQLLNDGDREGARFAVESILALDPPNLGEYRALLEKLSQG
ncbi:MAG TPA: tetratricopeptide repeat protein [Anaerolineales bacterium]|nr:tetratricopeptide repeat protein [Anaerolineales bacterium]